jgi:hypothetical protein
MKTLGKSGFIFFGILVAFMGFGQALDVDWKYYGGARFNEMNHFCFYDANSVVKQPDTHRRVWTKCLSQKNIDTIKTDEKVYKQIVENAARKIVGGYVPPIIAVQKAGFDKIAVIVSAEGIADSGNLQPSSRVLYEIDCSQMKLRESEMEYQIKGKTNFSKTTDWSHIPPETNAAILSKILCPLR